MLEGRSWQPLKERFTRSILYRLDCFDLSEDQRQQLDPNFSEELNFDNWNVEDLGGNVYSGDGTEEARGGHSDIARGRGVRRGRGGRGASLEASNPGQVRGRGRGRGRPRGETCYSLKHSFLILLPSWESKTGIHILGEELWGIKIRGGPKVY